MNIRYCVLSIYPESTQSLAPELGAPRSVMTPPSCPVSTMVLTERRGEVNPAAKLTPTGTLSII